MKALFIVYNQSITDMVQDILDKLTIKGYTQWTDIKGRGSDQGEPHEGTHTWPELNNAHLVIIQEEQVPPLVEMLDKVNKEVEKQGLRLFSWDIMSLI